MNRSIRALAVFPGMLAATLALSGCRRDRTVAAPRAAGSAAELLHPPFRPPADRLLTDRHLDLYVRVRRASRERSDSDAARALGVDPDEFAWARARIIEALVALDQARVRSAAAGTYSRTIASLRQTLKSVRDRETARTIEAQIAGLDRERAGMGSADRLPPEIAANAKRVSARRAELEAVSP